MARHGENIHKRKDGRWEARVIVGYDESHKASYKSIYGSTYDEVKQKKEKLVSGNSQKVTNHQFNWWFDSALQGLGTVRAFEARVSTPLLLLACLLKEAHFHSPLILSLSA